MSGFHIGGSPVLEKCLKPCKGRELSLAGMEHVRDIASALCFTVAQMVTVVAYRQASGD
jgi:hypothetical protein